jgi:hypothetical protein
LPWQSGEGERDDQVEAMKKLIQKRVGYTLIPRLADKDEKEHPLGNPADSGYDMRKLP